MSKYENYTPTELLRELSLTFGPSGCEGNVADIIKEFVAPYADEVTSDRLGTVIAVYRRSEDCVRSADPDEEPVIREGKPEIDKLMFAAHMDEVGFMIKSIDGDGYLKIAALSGRDPKTLAGRNVTVGDETKQYKGYFGVKPKRWLLPAISVPTVPILSASAPMVRTSRARRSTTVSAARFSVCS